MKSIIHTGKYNDIQTSRKLYFGKYVSEKIS